jgi:hypothetical protein
MIDETTRAVLVNIRDSKEKSIGTTKEGVKRLSASYISDG